MTSDFNTFDTFLRIDTSNPKTVEMNGRTEILLASGDQGQEWKYTQHTIPLKGRTEIQVNFIFFISYSIKCYRRHSRLNNQRDI